MAGYGAAEEEESGYDVEVASGWCGEPEAVLV